MYIFVFSIIVIVKSIMFVFILGCLVWFEILYGFLWFYLMCFSFVKWGIIDNSTINLLKW